MVIGEGFLRNGSRIGQFGQEKGSAGSSGVSCEIGHDSNPWHEFDELPQPTQYNCRSRLRARVLVLNMLTSPLARAATCISCKHRCRTDRSEASTVGPCLPQTRQPHQVLSFWMALSGRPGHRAACVHPATAHARQWASGHSPGCQCAPASSRVHYRLPGRCNIRCFAASSVQLTSRPACWLRSRSPSY